MRNKKIVAMAAALAALAASAGDGWRLGRETVPAGTARAYTLAGSAQQVLGVRAQWLSGATNTVGVGVALIAQADAYTNRLATFLASNATATATWTNQCWRTQATNALAKTGDQVAIEPRNVTNGVVTVEYLYTE